MKRQAAKGKSWAAGQGQRALGLAVSLLLLAVCALAPARAWPSPTTLSKTRVRAIEDCAPIASGVEAGKPAKCKGELRFVIIKTRRDNDFGQRFYDPKTSLWLGVDPLFTDGPGSAVGSPLVMSLYAYANQSPLAYIDPDGRSGKSVQRQARGGKASGPVSLPPSPPQPQGRVTYDYRFGRQDKEGNFEPGYGFPILPQQIGNQNAWTKVGEEWRHPNYLGIPIGDPFNGWDSRQAPGLPVDPSTPIGDNELGNIFMIDPIEPWGNYPMVLPGSGSGVFWLTNDSPSAQTILGIKPSEYKTPLDIPKKYRDAALEILYDLGEESLGDPAARARLDARARHELTGNLKGWTSVDLLGRADNMRLVYKHDTYKGRHVVKWMIVDTHQ